jgi:hypothetical protein
MLSFDHQLAEGRQATEFLRELAHRLQAYETALSGEPGQHTGAEELYCAQCLTPLSHLNRLDPLKRDDRFLIQIVKPGGNNEFRCNICVQGW